MRYPNIFSIIGGEEDCDYELALGHLLLNGDVFANSRKDGTIILYVGCNDIFAWACADAEDLPYSEVPALYRMAAISNWGSSKWCCIRRNEKPQAPVVEFMKKAEVWDAVMEALPENKYDKFLRERKK